MSKKAVESSSATPIRSTADLGDFVRAARAEVGSDQATTAGVAGVGVRFLGELERGKETLRFGLVLRVLDRLGFEVWVAPRGWRPHGR